jgi:hypothetical protein
MDFNHSLRTPAAVSYKICLLRQKVLRELCDINKISLNMYFLQIDI